MNGTVIPRTTCLRSKCFFCISVVNSLLKSCWFEYPGFIVIADATFLIKLGTNLFTNVNGKTTESLSPNLTKITASDFVEDHGYNRQEHENKIRQNTNVINIEVLLY